MKASLHKLFGNLAIISAIAFAPVAADAADFDVETYYKSLNGKCGKALMEAIKDLCIDHTELSYSSGTWNAFKETDVRTIDGVDYWWDMYSSDLVRVSSGHPGLNVEHSVPNSWWGGTKNAAYKDICHLNPSNTDANSRKGNYPLSEIETVKWTNGVTTVGSPKSGQGGGTNIVYEPADEYKGDFARAYMYMFTVYSNLKWKPSTDWMYDTSSSEMFKLWAKNLLLRWHNTDPVSTKERNRNNGIQKTQGNRNPFIDLPDLASHIWGDKKTEPYSVSGAPVNPDPDPEPGPDPTPDDNLAIEWLESTSTEMSEGWTIENINLPEQATYVWKWSDNKGKNYYLKGSCYINGTPYAAKAYAYSPTVDLAGYEDATFSFEHAARYQTTIKDLCRVVVREEGGEWTEIVPQAWPSAGGWNFVKSGDIDLSAYDGKKIQIGFKYESSAEGADTWEINNCKLTATKKTSGIDNLAPADEDDSFLVEVWGNSIAAPEGSRVFDLNGREVGKDNLQKGIYIVTKPTFDKAVKVMVK